MNPKVSVIVPIYNVEKFLPRCIDSLVCQSFLDKEIILVNDGATDDSPKIIQDYANRYDSIKLIHKPNGGQSSARNRGLQVAKGQYILFVDSDDYIAPNALELLCSMADFYALDILRGKCFYCNEAGALLKIGMGSMVETQQVMEGEAYLKCALDCGGYDIVPWVNLIRKAYLDGCGLVFHEGVFYEDQEYTLKLLTSGAKRVMQTDLRFYFYRQHPMSTTARHTLRKALDLLLVMEEMKRYIEESQLCRDTQHDAYRTVSIAFFHMIYLYLHLSKQDKKKLVSCVNPHLCACVRAHPTLHYRMDFQNRLWLWLPQLFTGWYHIKNRLKKLFN